jgi:hypothetical protein
VGSGNGTSLVGILPLLAAGFIFNGIFYITRFRLSKADGQRLFFSCVISGFTVGCIAFAACYALRSHVPADSVLRQTMDWLHRSIPVPYGLTFTATILLAVIFGHCANAYLWVRKKMKAPHDKRRVSVWAYWRSMPEYITALDELLRRAVFDDKLVLLCLKSRKVYCGLISETRGNHESAVAHVQLIPAFSITRDKDTLKFKAETKTEYRAYSLKRAVEREETLNGQVRDTIGIYRLLSHQNKEDRPGGGAPPEGLIEALRAHINGQASSCLWEWESYKRIRCFLWGSSHQRWSSSCDRCGKRYRYGHEAQ